MVGYWQKIKESLSGIEYPMDGKPPRMTPVDPGFSPQTGPTVGKLIYNGSGKISRICLGDKVVSFAEGGIEEFYSLDNEPLQLKAYGYGIIANFRAEGDRYGFYKTCTFSFKNKEVRTLPHVVSFFEIVNKSDEKADFRYRVKIDAPLIRCLMTQELFEVNLKDFLLEDVKVEYKKIMRNHDKYLVFNEGGNQSTQIIVLLPDAHSVRYDKKEKAFLIEVAIGLKPKETRTMRICFIFDAPEVGDTLREYVKYLGDDRKERMRNIISFFTPEKIESILSENVQEMLPLAEVEKFSSEQKSFFANSLNILYPILEIDKDGRMSVAECLDYVYSNSKDVLTPVRDLLMNLLPEEVRKELLWTCKNLEAEATQLMVYNLDGNVRRDFTKMPWYKQFFIQGLFFRYTPLGREIAEILKSKEMSAEKNIKIKKAVKKYIKDFDRLKAPLPSKRLAEKQPLYLEEIVDRADGEERVKPRMERSIYREFFTVNYMEGIEENRRLVLNIAGLIKDVCDGEGIDLTKILLENKIPWIDTSTYQRFIAFPEVYVNIMKERGMAPHDDGCVGTPFSRRLKLTFPDAVNGYPYNNSNYWMDLLPKLIVDVYRYYVFTGSVDRDYLSVCFPELYRGLRRYNQRFVKVCLPFEQGYPSTTFDNFACWGHNIYSAFWYLTSLDVMKSMANILGEKGIEDECKMLLKEGLVALEKMWNEEKGYYNLSYNPEDGSITKDVLFAQIEAIWIALLSLQKPLIPFNRAKKILANLYEHNFIRKTNTGPKKTGAINIMPADGALGDYSQAVEVWVGVNAFMSAFMKLIGEALSRFSPKDREEAERFLNYGNELLDSIIYMTKEQNLLAPPEAITHNLEKYRALNYSRSTAVLLSLLVENMFYHDKRKSFFRLNETYLEKFMDIIENWMKEK